MDLKSYSRSVDPPQIRWPGRPGRRSRRRLVAGICRHPAAARGPAAGRRGAAAADSPSRVRGPVLGRHREPPVSPRPGAAVRTPATPGTRTGTRPRPSLLRTGPRPRSSRAGPSPKKRRARMVVIDAQRAPSAMARGMRDWQSNEAAAAPRRRHSFAAVALNGPPPRSSTALSGCSTPRLGGSWPAASGRSSGP